jgi:hypothetical protein
MLTRALKHWSVWQEMDNLPNQLLDKKGHIMMRPWLDSNKKAEVPRS